MGRRRNGRRKKGRRRNVSWTPHLEKRVAQKRNSRVDEDRRHERRKELLERKGEDHERNNQLEVYVGNIDYRAPAEELKALLENHYGQVNKIELVEDRRFLGAGRSRGYGFVTFDSPRSAEDAVNASPSVLFRGRTLRINTGNPKKGQRRPSMKIKVPMLSFNVGVMNDRNRQWSSAWSADEDGSAIDFAVDGSTRKLYCRFSKGGTSLTDYEVQIYMKEVVGDIVLQYEGNGSVVMFVNVWRCPKMFREVRAGDDGDGSVIHDHFLSNLFRDNFRYDREAVETVRTVDPTSGRFGSFLSYRICLPHRDTNCRRILDLLSHYNLTEDHARIRYPGHIDDSAVWRPNPAYDARAFRLSFSVRYELEALATAARINKEDLNADFLGAVKECSDEKAVIILRKMVENVDPKHETSEDMADLFVSWCNGMSCERGHSFRSGDGDEENCYVQRAAATPMRIAVLPQEMETKNRVLRSVPRDRLLRLQFTDENMSLLSYQSLSPDIMARVRRILNNGISIGGRKFVFLAFSSSQLKEHGCWLLSECGDMTSDALRRQMGDFSSINIPGKLAARMGQCFSTTHVGSSEELSSHEWQHIEDVKHNGYVFSDGIGTISTDLLAEVANHRGYNMHVLSAIQVRVGGVKGVLCHDPTLRGRLICTRPSQEKFIAPSSRDLEICSRAQFLPCFLNRQLITLLSTLGVKDKAFEELQDNMLRAFRGANRNSDIALRMLRESGSLEMAQQMIEAGIDVGQEPFLRMLLKALKSQRLQDLKLKTRLLVPNGCLLMGVMDETATLEYGECFLQVQRSFENNPTIITGNVVVGKNPCLHPGDILHLNATDTPHLRHLVNVVFFPQKGKRPHPDETAGSDLDGDMYSIIWDKSLFPSETFPPMDYSGPSPKILDRPVTILDVTSFFCDFIQNDNLGPIANAHLAIADQSEDGARDPRCLALAQLHSMAVDFNKTGIPAEFPRNLRVKAYPDFMEKKDKASYASQKVIGKLFRDIKDLTRHSPLQRRDSPIEDSYDSVLGDFIYDDTTSDDMLHDAYIGRETYNQELISIMNKFGVHREGEVITGFILKFFRRYSKAKKKFDVMERVKIAIKALERKARQYFDETASGYMTDDMDEIDRQLVCMELASSFYYVTYHPNASNELGLLSFPWISAADHLCSLYEVHNSAVAEE